MTREEEIIKEAKLCASANTQIIGDWGEHYLGFIHGAEWADHTMIAKACEWLEQNAYHYCDDIDTLHESALIGDFRHAMKGE